MPKVNGKEFAYTPEGIAKAKAEGKRMGKKVEYHGGGGLIAGGTQSRRMRQGAEVAK